MAVHGRALIDVAERAPPHGAVRAGLDPHRRRDRVARPGHRVEHPDPSHQVIHRSRLGDAPDPLAQGGGHLAQLTRAVAEHAGAGLGAGDQISQRPQLGSQFRHGGTALQQLVRHPGGRTAGTIGSRHLGPDARASGQRPLTHRTTSPRHDTQGSIHDPPGGATGRTRRLAGRAASYRWQQGSLVTRGRPSQRAGGSAPASPAAAREPPPGRCIVAGWRSGRVARLAANGHSRPAAPSHTEPHNACSDGTSSLACHHPATL